MRLCSRYSFRVRRITIGYSHHPRSHIITPVARLPHRATRQLFLWARRVSHGARLDDVREGGVYYNRVFEFCFEDTHCRERLESFEFAYERARNASRYADARGEGRDS